MSEDDIEDEEAEDVQKICPFMSNTDVDVNCDNDCGLYDEEKQQCGILTLAQRKTMRIKQIEETNK